MLRPQGRIGQTRTRSLCAVIALVSAMAMTVQAAPGKPPILVFESSVEADSGLRTEAVERALGVLRDALESRGFAARPKSILRIAGNNAPRPAILDPGITAAAVAQRIADGYIDYTQSQFEQASKTLREAITLIHRNPGVLAFDTGNTNMVFKAYVGLVNSYMRLGRAPEAVAEMTELIRIYPLVAVTRASYGPEAEQMYRSVWKQVRALGRGRLSITTGHPQAMIFVDGQIRGIGAASLGELIPGLYHVFIQVPGRVGRQYIAEVRPDEDTALDTAWSVDSALSIGDQAVELRFRSNAERDRAGSLAGSLVRRWNAGHLVAVLALLRRQAHPVLIGTLYRTDGAVVWSALLDLERAGTAQLVALARFLADGTPGGLEILAGAKAPPRRRAPAGAWDGPWIACAGVVLLATGIGLYLIDEDEVENGDVQPSYRDTARGGIITGAAGLASIGFGLWWWRRSRSTAAPVISLGPSHAAIGWVGHF